VTAVIDVFLSAAPQDAAVSRELAEALTASGITSFSGASDRSSAEALTALETARTVVLVLSASANATPDIVRELERAAARGIPIIPYAIENVAPSPSIAYFTVTVPPIPAWSGDRQQMLLVLVQAARRALTESAPAPARSTLHGTRYLRATYVEGRGLQNGVAILLAITACVNVYAFYRDAGYVASPLLGRPGASVAAADHLGWMQMASSQAIWTVIVSAILVFRRARLNLLSLFGYVQTTASEIFWRPLVPIASAFWLPAIARDLRSSSGAAGVSEADDWPLARYWGLVFLGAYLLIGFRDTLLRMAPQRSGLVVVMSAALDALQIVLAPLTYAVLAHVLEGVRAKHRSRHSPQPAAIDSPSASPTPAAAEAPSTGPNVLVLHAAGDEAIAASVANGLAEYQCQCWTLNPASQTSGFAAQDLAGFTTVLVVVSRVSHASEAITSQVRTALASVAPVIPFVVDPPPSGSTLGHYIRSLHWIDGGAGPATLRSERVRSVLLSTRVGAGAAAVSMPSLADGLFSPLQVTATTAAHYRSSRTLRAIARALAFVQIVAALFVGLIAVAVAFFPEGVTSDAPLWLSLYLVAASLPAWGAFLAWIRRAHSNAQALRLPAPRSRVWSLVQVAVPGLSLVLGGRTIGRLWAATRGPEEKQRGWQDAVTRFQVMWTAAGFIWTVAAIAGVLLGALGSFVLAMVASAVQCLATAARGLLRARIIKDAGSRLDDRARREWQTAD
jgi:hypothetical protein